ncbi:MAG: nucleoside-diphosphate sugar epimerase/dehydratase [Tepidisphaeraceae bacterium]
MLDRVRDFLKGRSISAGRSDLPRDRAAQLSLAAANLRAMPELDALLGRKAINLDTPELQRFISQKRVMITGAGGSIGSEICRQSARFGPNRLILVERAENALFEIDRELRERWIGVDVRPCMADVTDTRRIEAVFKEHQPDVIFHAAAHKHVPMMELNPGEAIKNNVFGTLVVATCAREHGAEAFVLISTDKAVNPSSVMGATKRVAEMIVQAVGSGEWGVGRRDVSLANRAPSLHTPRSTIHTRFLAVRFGNVLGSSGSVVPIFRKQIEAGGPVTVTHPEMRRYFMTIPEATQLVMQAGAIGQGGEIFVLDMGEPMRILDLAQQMIRHAGLVEGRDIEIRITGVRPGEKLFEELAGADERTRPTTHPKIRVWELPTVDASTLEAMLSDLRRVTDAPPTLAMSALRSVVPEFAVPITAPVAAAA